MGLKLGVRRRARPVVHAVRRYRRQAGAVARPWQPWDGHHHPALLEFPPWQGVADGQFAYDFLGVRTDPQVVEHLDSMPAGPLTTAYPEPHSSDYFEYAFVLDSVLATADADRPFTFVELGAGWGAWMAIVHRAVGSSRSVRLVGVEMEPQHFRWMVEHLRHNDIDPEDHTLLQAAVSDYNGEAVFVPQRRPDQEYGLRIMKASGSPVTGPKGQVRTRCIRLASLLGEHDIVDLMHVDIQGEELRTLGGAWDDIDAKVGRMIVGTHSRRIHRDLRALLVESGWRQAWDFGHRKRERTPFGDVAFVDGVLAFVNPKVETSR